MEVTREELAKALDHLWVYAVNRDGTHHGQIADPGPVSHELWEHLLALPEAPGDVVDAHICCDHADAGPDVSLADIAGSHVDTELALMAAILHGMEQLDRDARQRIRNWVDERFVPRRLSGPF